MINGVMSLPEDMGKLLKYQRAMRWEVQLAGFDSYGETNFTNLDEKREIVRKISDDKRKGGKR